MSTADLPPYLTSNALQLLWQWNRTDTTQFELSSGYKTDTGTAFAGTVTPSVVANGFQNEPLLRLTAAGLTGGQILFIKTSEFLYPAAEPIVFQVRLQAMSIASINATVGLFISDSGGVIRGLNMARIAGAANCDWRIIKNAQPSSLQSQTNIGSWTIGTVPELIGGEDYWFEILRRQNGSATPIFSLRFSAQGYGVASNGFDSSGAYDALFVGGLNPNPDFNNVDMPRIGVGMWTGTATQNGTVDFLDMRIFKSALYRP